MQAILGRAPSAAPARPDRKRLAGRIVTALPVLFLLFDASIKLSQVPAVAEASRTLGIPNHLNPLVALIELVCLALYLVPRTAAVGAVLLTGFLGGAVAMQLRIGSPLLSHTLFPLYVGALLWAGLWLRDARVRALLRPAE
jgi:hypothetical protein